MKRALKCTSIVPIVQYWKYNTKHRKLLIVSIDWTFVLEVIAWSHCSNYKFAHFNTWCSLELSYHYACTALGFNFSLLNIAFPSLLRKWLWWSVQFSHLQPGNLSQWKVHRIWMSTRGLSLRLLWVWMPECSNLF